ncbi:MAG: glycosyltransferase [Patescibacteria group bacterium]|jgi:glycosyltransferase involved in cell wall biosynthesis
MKKPRVVLIHDYLVQYGGAEKTLEAIAEIFPDAPIYTGIYNPKSIPETITRRKIITGKNPFLKLFPKYLTFLMPLLFESFDLRDYDIVVSDGTAWPKGVLTTPDQLHISYIHTPPRFLYKYSVESRKRNKWYHKPAVALIDHFLRIWDFSSAQRPDFLLTNSKETQRRIWKFYKRESVVIYPPVDVDRAQPEKEPHLEKPYYLALGRLAAYKNFDILISAFNLLNIPLKIVGTGPEEKRLKKLAGQNIQFLGHVSEEQKSKIIEGCKGVLFPVVDEDFGIVPIEALSHGKPVLAHRSGGPIETIRENIDGMFFEEVSTESLVSTIKIFDDKIDSKAFDGQQSKIYVQRFGKERFKKEFADFVHWKWEEHARTTGSINNSSNS